MYMSVYGMHNKCRCLQKPEEEAFPGTGGTEDYEPLFESWKLNLGSLQEQYVFLTFEFNNV